MKDQHCLTNCSIIVRTLLELKHTNLLTNANGRKVSQRLLWSILNR